MDMNAGNGRTAAVDVEVGQTVSEREVIKSLEDLQKMDCDSDKDSSPEVKRVKLDQDVIGEKNHTTSSVLFSAEATALESEHKTDQSSQAVLPMEIDSEPVKTVDESAGGYQVHGMKKSSEGNLHSGLKQNKQEKNVVVETVKPKPDAMAPFDKNVVGAKAGDKGGNDANKEEFSVTMQQLIEKRCDALFATNDASRVGKERTTGKGTGETIKVEKVDKESMGSVDKNDIEFLTKDKKTPLINNVLQKALDTAMRMLEVSVDNSNDDRVKTQRNYALRFLSSFKAMHLFKQKLCKENPELKKNYWTDEFPKTRTLYQREFMMLLSLTGHSNEELLSIGKGFYGLCVLAEKNLDAK